MIGQLSLRRHPVFDGNQREIGAVAFAGFRIDRERASRPVASTKIVDANDKKLARIERLSRADQIVPPPHTARIAGVYASNMMAS